MQIGTLSPDAGRTIKDLETIMERWKHLFKGHGLPRILVSPLAEEEKLGYYSPQENVIVLREDFAIFGGKEDVTNVFLHELAHALDFSRNGQAGHGPSFRVCCSELGVAENFSKAHVANLMTDRRKVSDKVAKLLRLASSPYLEEGRSALAMAERLMAMHGLKYAEKNTEDKLYFVHLLEKKRFMQSEKKMLGLARSLTGCFLVFESTEDGSRAATAYGSLEQVEGTMYIFSHLRSGMEKALENAIRANGAIDRESYRIGLLLGLEERLENRDEKLSSALEISSKKNRELYSKLSGARMRCTRSRLQARSASSYELGREMSRDMELPRKGAKWTSARQIEYKKP